MRTENIRSVIVAFLYNGGADKEPRSHVARMPPEFVIINPMAMAVARRVCGAVLFAFHVANAGAAQKLPEIEKNKLPYRTPFECAPKYVANPIMLSILENIVTSPRQR